MPNYAAQLMLEVFMNAVILQAAHGPMFEYIYGQEQTPKEKTIIVVV
jgi:hypothetical protein